MSNLVGSPHLKYVQDQIKTRQEILGRTTRSNEDISWENSKTAWIRLVSSVDIADQEVYQLVSGSNEPQLLPDNGKEIRNQFLGLSEYGGNQLSNELILQGGAQNGNTKRFGITDENSILPSSNFNYGYGGLEFGIKPIPGITSFSSKTYNKGSLREAEVSIIAHNRKQFEYLESTYLRLGYTMLLEWGNSRFPKDTSTYSNTQDIAELSLKNEFLNDKGSGPTKFYTQIEKLREQSKGNYDAFLATVKNFTWEFTKEEQYVITLNLISIGSVVESLKVNLPSNRITYPPQGLNSNVQNSTNEGFSNALINLIQSVTIPTPQNPDQNDKVIIPYIPGIPFFGKKLKDNKYQSIKYDNDNNVVACFANYGGNKFVRYIRFETLLKLINDNLLIYDDGGNPSLIKIDLDNELYCYSNSFSISSDPSKMLVNFEKNITGTDINIFPTLLPPFHTTRSGVKVGLIKNLFFSSEYLTQEIESNVDSDGNLSLYNFLNNLLITANNLLGGVNKLNLRIVDKEYTFTEEEIPQAIDLALITEENIISNDDGTFSIIQQVLEMYDEVQPYEKEKLFKSQEEIPSFKIYGLEPNKGGFVTDFSLRTEITSKLATMISIGAQAGGTSAGEDATIFSKWNIGLVDRIIPNKKDKDTVEGQKQLAGEKEIALQPLKQLANISNSYFKFIKLFGNSELDLETQEISPEDQSRIDSLNEQIEALDKKETQQKRELQKKIDEIKEQQFTGYGFPDVYLTTVEGKTNFTNFIKIQKEFFRLALSYDALRKQTITPTIGFLPINLSLTFDGLSGIRIFDKLKIDSKFLPNNYGNTLEFIITELDHFINNNKWYTRVGTLSIPNTTDKPEALIQLEELSSLATQVSDLTDFVGSYSYQYSVLGQAIRNTFNSNDNRINGITRIPGELLYPPLASTSIPRSKRGGAGRQSVLVSIGELGKNYYYNKSYDNVKLSSQDADTAEFYKSEYDGNYFLEKQAAFALTQLIGQAKNDGISFTITSAYRSLDHQTRLSSSGVAAKPGSSPHNYGGAIDIGEIAAVTRNSNGKLTDDPEINKRVRETNKIYIWLQENGPKYGWYNPARLRDGQGQDETWHWEFWGVPGDSFTMPSYADVSNSPATLKTITYTSPIPEINENNNTLAINVKSPYISKKGNITSN